MCCELIATTASKLLEYNDLKHQQILRILRRRQPERTYAFSGTLPGKSGPEAGQFDPNLALCLVRRKSTMQIQIRKRIKTRTKIRSRT
jgi:hypothetical protein